MAEILLSTFPLSSDQLKWDCGLSDDQLSGFHKPSDGIWHNQPYLIDRSPRDTSIRTVFNCIQPREMRNLTELGASLGGDNLQAVASLHGQLM